MKLIKYDDIVVVGRVLYTTWYLYLSLGDCVRLSIPSEEAIPNAERFSAIYEVKFDRTHQVPYLEPLPATGRELSTEICLSRSDQEQLANLCGAFSVAPDAPLEDVSLLFL